MPEAWDHFAPVKLDLFRILAFCQAGLFAVRAVERPGRFSVSLNRIPAVVPAGALILAGALALGPALAGHGKPLAVLDLVLGAGLLVMLAGEHDRGLAGKMLALNAGAAGLASVYGLTQYFGLDLFSWRQAFAGSAPASTYGNPLFFGDGLAGALPFAVAGLLSSRRNFRLYSVVLSLLISAGLLVTQARGAWAGALAGLAVLFLLMGREMGGRKAWLGLLGAGVAAIFLWAANPGPLNPGSGTVFRKAGVLLEQGSGGFRGRFLLWESTARMVRDNPVWGAGLGEFPGHYNIYQGPLLASPRYAGLEYHSSGHAHQDYLQMAAETGVVGLGLFLWVVVAVIAGFRGDFFRRIGQAGNSGQRFRVAALGGAVALLFDAWFNGPLHIPPSAQWIWMLMGLSVISPDTVARRNRSGEPRHIPAHWLVLAALVAVMVARPFARDLAGEVYQREAQVALEENRPELALAEAIDSFALSIEDRRHRFLLGRSYYLSGRYGESAEQFAQDAMENPGMASAWHNLGLSLMQEGRGGLAVQAYHRALLLDPTDKVLPGLIQEAGKAPRTGKRGNGPGAKLGEAQ